MDETTPPGPGADPLVRTRLALQSVAEHVLAPALHAATGHIGLRATPGGFGTPWIDGVGGGRRRLRVDGTDLVVEVGDGARRAPLTTVRAAADQAGIAPGAPAGVYPPATPLVPDAPLSLDPAAAHLLADWYALVDDALGALSAEAGPDQASAVQLWPEHFDLATSIGEVNYGGSPGDAGHDQPYLYVGPWSPPTPDGGYWNEGFGASLAVDQVPDAEGALAFFRRGRSPSS
jgi:hypothetical protein